jgi:hypothetical protein
LREPVDSDARAPLGRMVPQLAAQVSKGYAWAEGQYQTVPLEHIFPGAAPAGSLFSTAGDMACFALAYLNNGAYGGARILEAQTVQTMRQRRYNDRPDAADFAHGWFNYRLGGREVYQHTGAMLSFTSNLTLIPELGLGVFVAANSTTGWPVTAETPRHILQRLDPSLAAEQLHSVPDGAPQLSWFAGRYLNTVRSYSYLDTILQLHSGEAIVTPSGENALRISIGDAARVWSRVGALLFEDEELGEQLRFVADNRGKMLRFYGPLGHRAYERQSYWRSSAFLDHAMAIAAGLGFFTFLFGALGKLSIPYHAPLLQAIRDVSVAASALGVGLPWLVARSVEGAAARGGMLMFDWPPPELQQLVWSGYLLALLIVALLTGQICIWKSLWPILVKAQQTLLALALLVALAALASWNLFAPAMHT